MLSLALLATMVRSHEYLSFELTRMQAFDDSCGIASVLTLVEQDPHSSDLVALGIEVPVVLADLIGRTISFADMARLLTEFGYVSRGFRMSRSELIETVKRYYPIIAHLAEGDRQHFVVVSRYESAYGYLVQDPATGTRWWDDETFERYWTGAVLVAATDSGETRLADLGEERYIRAERRAQRLEYYSHVPPSIW